MVIRFHLPPELEQQLRDRLGDLDQAAKEAMGVEWFRQGTLSHAQLTRLLNCSRFDTDAILKRHGVLLDFSLDDVLTESETSRRARGG